MTMDVAERDLWQRYARDRSPRLREEIITNYAVLAKRAVDRLQITPWGCVSYDDLISSAVIGLIDAIDRFEPALGVPFQNYAMPRLRGAVIDALRGLDWVPRSVRSEETKLRRAIGRLEGRLGRSATDEEIASELEITVDDLDLLTQQVAKGSVLSLDDLLAGPDEDSGPSHEPSGDSGIEMQRAEERRAARMALVKAIQALPEREKLIVSLYYQQELTLKEIGKVLSVSEQRVSQLHAKAIMRLNGRLTRERDLLTAIAA
jgi:RNA polymerase sigma factor FliA